MYSQRQLQHEHFVEAWNGREVERVEAFHRRNSLNEKRYRFPQILYFTFPTSAL